MSDRVEPVRTSATTAAATSTQEYFWSMALDDADPSAYVMRYAFVIEGALDHERFRACITALVDAHEVFRTTLREVAGELQQIVLPATDFALEMLERTGLPESEWNGEIQRTCDELVGRGFDLGGTHLIRARLTQLDRDRHALVVIFHHVVADAASALNFFRRLFAMYASGDPPVEQPALQYVDVAAAFERWNATPAGETSRTYWQRQATGAPPAVVPSEHTREAVDARRDAARRGITADRMHPAQYAKLANDVRETVTRVARQHRVSIYGVYAAGLAWLLHEQTGQTDLCVEATADLRPLHPAFAEIQGPLTFWSLLRIDLAGCARFGDAIPRVGAAVADAKKHGWIEDYYRLVPHTARRVIINYVPLRWLATPAREYPGLRVHYKPQPFPRWKRPWDLHLTIIDGDDVVFAWTGHEKLFGQDKLSALLARYVEILNVAPATAAR